MGFSKTSLSLLLLSLYILLCSSDATSRNSHGQLFRKTPNFSPDQRAEKLIKSLNLFPKNPVNIVNNSIDFVPGKIVEKTFSFLGGPTEPTIENLGHHAGYYSLPRSKSARMFYFFFESRNNTRDDPTVIWLTGGPGCSSQLALFFENGPFHIADDLSLVWNNYGWDKVSNILFVDQPIGTGFSYTSNESEIPHDEIGVSNDLYDFLQAILKQHSNFVKNDFYIIGESYAGHYVPALASRIHRGNKNKEGININLKGFAIGNGWTNPIIQYPANTQYAFDMKLITKEDQNKINQIIPGCQDAIKTCVSKGGQSCSTAVKSCESIMGKILEIAGNNVNYYDIRKQCDGELCYDFSYVEDLLNDNSVKEALGVGNVNFVSCSTVVYNAMLQDVVQNLEVDIPTLLEDGIKCLIYAGEYDLSCNWLGNSNWVHAMEWSGQKQFASSKTVPFLVDGAQAGLLNSFGPLSFLKVNGAGHMVPMDQPNAALQMLVNWMHGTLK